MPKRLTENEINKDVLYKLYVLQQKPMHQIADELGVAIGTVYKYIHKYNINPRSQKESFDVLKENGWEYPQDAKDKIKNKLTGRKISEETRQKMSESAKQGGIGHKKKRPDGYITIYFPDHPKSTADGYIMEHDLVMECLIGRHLNPEEVVHHINFKRDDNRKENLKLMTFKEHAAFHMKRRHEEKQKGGMTYQ